MMEIQRAVFKAVHVQPIGFANMPEVDSGDVSSQAALGSL